MTNLETASLQMELGLKVYFATNLTLLSTAPNLATHISTFNAQTDLAEDLALQQSIDTHGVVVNKDMLRDNITITIIDFCTRILALANETNNVDLKTKVNISDSDLKKLSDYKFYDKALSIQLVAQANILALPAYGITAALNTAFLGSVKTYHTALIDVDTLQEQHKQITVKLKALLKKTKKLLRDHIDTLMKTFQFTNVDLYNQYLDTSTPKPTKGVRHRSIVGKVYDDKGILLAKALIKLSDVKKDKKSSKKGGFAYSNLETKDYEITITFNGLKLYRAILNINAGVTTKLVVRMEK